MRSGSESKQTDIDSIRVAFLLFARPATTCQSREEGSSPGSFSRHSTMRWRVVPSWTRYTTQDGIETATSVSRVNRDIKRYRGNLVSQNSLLAVLFVIHRKPAAIILYSWLDPSTIWPVIRTILVINSIKGEGRKWSTISIPATLNSSIV